MQELEITWPRLLSVWWLIAWRSFLGAFLISGGVGFVIGFVGGLLGVPNETIVLLSGTVGGLIGLAWSIMVIRMALRKNYRGFRIALVPTGDAALATHF